METANAGSRCGKLIAGARIALLAPEWNRDCDDCRMWWFNEDGSIRRDGLGNPVKRGCDITPCDQCAKVPMWAKRHGLPMLDLRSKAFQWFPENLKAFQAYCEFRAVGQFPDDAIVRWYSAIIHPIVEQAGRVPFDRLAALIATVVSIGRK